MQSSPFVINIFGQYSISVPHTCTFLSSRMHITHRTSNVIAHTNKRTKMEAEAEKNLPALTHKHTQNNIIKRVGGMPWEPTGVCLWGRRGQVWGHTSSVSAERRVDHTNSIMATNTAIMRPQISTTKMPPMFSMPRPGSGPQETNISTRLFFCWFFFFQICLPWRVLHSLWKHCVKFSVALQEPCWRNSLTFWETCLFAVLPRVDGEIVVTLMSVR